MPYLITYVKGSDKATAYHAYHGEAVDDQFKGIKPTTHGYLVMDTPTNKTRTESAEVALPKLIQVDQYLDGVVYHEAPVSSVGNTLMLLLQLQTQYAHDKLIVPTTDPYLTKVVTQWWPAWEDYAVKGNGQPIEDGELWMQVKKAGIQFELELVAGKGQYLADTYIHCKDGWQSSLPAKKYFTERTSKNPLMWLNVLLDAPGMPLSQTHFHTATNPKIMELGRPSALTTYGAVQLATPDTFLLDIINDVRAFSDTLDILAYHLNEIYGAFTNTLLTNFGLSFLYRPELYRNDWQVNERVIVTEMNPPNMIINALTVTSALHRLLNQFTPEGTEEVRVCEVTEELAPGKKLSPVFDNETKIKLTLPNGLKGWYVANRDLPDINGLRALIKQGSQFYTAHLRVNNSLRSALIITNSSGRAIYSPWVTNVIPIKKK